MKRIWINKIYIFKTATKWTCNVFAMLGFITMFTSFSNAFDCIDNIVVRIVLSLCILISTWVVSFCLISICVLRNYRVKLFGVSNGYNVYVQYGDIFNTTKVVNHEQRRNIVIPVNRCFDTLIDDDLISSNTLHGIAMKKLYASKKFTSKSLNKAINDNLELQNISYQDITRVQKRSGNLKRYPAGTVAEVKGSNCTYFFLGLSEFDENLHANTSDEDYVLSIMKLLTYCNLRSQKYPVLIPLIGAGAANTRKNEHDILEYMIKLIKMNKDLINCDMHIVIRESGKDSIAITDL